MASHRELAARLQDVLHHEIPLTGPIGLSVESYDGERLALRAPLAPNINHKATAFAGSLNAVLTLAGWGFTWLALAERGLTAVVVIQASETNYNLPVNADFVATCASPGEHQVERFVASLRRRGKARITLTAEIHDTERRVAASFSGAYVAFLSETGDSETDA